MSTNTFEKLRVGPAPHIRNNLTTRRVMFEVIIALLPAMLASFYYFGATSVATVVAAVVAAVLAEYIWQKLMKKTVTVSDLSAVVTGILLAFNLPPEVPFWMPVIGSVFAIILCKQLFGGLGHNFINPALAARAVLVSSWPVHMTSFVHPDNIARGLEGLSQTVDSVTSATPLALLKQGTPAANINLWDMFIGVRGGSIGETCALLLLLGGIYLIARRIINARIPVAMLGTIAVMAFAFGGEGGLFTGDFTTIAVHLLGGGAILGAFFMASDYTTTPVTSKGQWIFGIGVGLITMSIRLWGGFSEGVSYAILIMNVASPLIERYTRPSAFGSEVKRNA